jgi:exonuclease I
MQKLTCGYTRAEIIGALISILIIWGVTAWLVYKGITRVIHPIHVDGRIMFVTAVFGLGQNLLMMKVLHTHDDIHQHKKSRKGQDKKVGIKKLMIKKETKITEEKHGDNQQQNRANSRTSHSDQSQKTQKNKPKKQRRLFPCFAKDKKYKTSKLNAVS